jgi:hypothetical protein
MVRQVYEAGKSGGGFWRWVEFVDDAEGQPAGAAVRQVRHFGGFDSGLDSGPSRASDPGSVDPMALVKVVKTSHGLKDSQVAETLAGMGARAIPTLLRMAQTEVATIQPILNAIDPEESVPALVESLESGAGSVRRMAAVLLGFPSLLPESRRASEALVRASNDQDASVRAAALRSLVVAAEPAISVPPLVSSLRDAEVIVRHAAAVALGQLGPLAQHALGALREAAANDQDASVRSAVTSAIQAVEAR